MPKKVIPIPLNKGLSVPVNGPALAEGYLQEASNCFYDQYGNLETWKPKFTAGYLSNPHVVQKIYPEDDRIIFVNSTDIYVRQLDGTLVDDTNLTGTVTSAQVCKFGEYFVVASNGNPLVAFTADGDFFDCGSHLYSDGPATYASATPLTATDTTYTRLQYTPAASDRKHQISFVTFWLARDIYTTGELKCQVTQGANTWTSDNRVFVGALPYTSDDAREFYEARFIFSGCTPSGTGQISVSLVTHNLDHPDGTPKVYTADVLTSTTKTLITSTIDSQIGAVRINGAKGTDGYDRCTSAFGRLFLAKTDSKVCLVSNVGDKDDYDSPNGGGWFTLDFLPTAITAWQNSILVSGEGVLQSYAGTWPDNIEAVSRYSNWVSYPEGWANVDESFVTVSEGRLVIGTPLDRLGSFAWKALRCPWLATTDTKWHLYFFRPLNLLLCWPNNNSSKIYVLQLATGQWSTWDFPGSYYLDDFASTGTAFYAVDHNGQIYTVTLAAGTGYDVTVTPKSVYLGGDTVKLKRVMITPGLPDGAKIAVTGYNSIPNYDSWDPATTTGPTETEVSWSKTVTLNGAASGMASTVIPVDTDNPDAFMFDVTVTFPSAVSKTTSDAINAIALVVDSAGGKTPVGDV